MIRFTPFAFIFFFSFGSACACVSVRHGVFGNIRTQTEIRSKYSILRIKIAKVHAAKNWIVRTVYSYLFVKNDERNSTCENCVNVQFMNFILHLSVVLNCVWRKETVLYDLSELNGAQNCVTRTSSFFSVYGAELNVIRNNIPFILNMINKI